MLRKRIKAAIVLILFLVAGVLYSTDRNQDFFVEEKSAKFSTESQEAGNLADGQETATASEKADAAASEKADNTASEKADNTSSESAVSIEAGERIRVHVCGAVKVAGVYRLAPHAIVEEAITAAGGFIKGSARDYLNLALELSDGDKVYVPYQSELEEQYGGDGQLLNASGSVLIGSGDTKGQGTGTSSEEKRININTADESQLTTLPGIGAARAQAIISWRNEHGAFEAIEDIMQVSGIKEGAFAKIKDRICVS